MTAPKAKEQDIEHVSATSSFEGDLAVKTLDAEQPGIVDGPIMDTSESWRALTSFTSGSETTSCTDKPGLDSPFLTPHVKAEDTASQIPFEDGKILEEYLSETKAVKADDMGVSPVEKAEELKNEDIIGAEPETIKKKIEMLYSENSASAEVAVASKSELEIVGSSFVPSFQQTGTKDLKEEGVTEAKETTFILEEAIQEIILDSCPANVTGAATAENCGDSPAEVPNQAEPSRGIPPHLRPNSRTPPARDTCLQNAKHSTYGAHIPLYAEIPCAPRYQYGPLSYNSYRPDSSREELARTYALLMKTRNELTLERQKYTSMRQTISAEKERVFESALASQMTDLISKQAKTLAHQANVEAKERDLEYRQARMDQIEVFLSEGQKQFFYQYDKQESVRTAADIVREHERRQAELKAQKDIADIKGKLAVKMQELRIHATAQEMREKQYKAIIRSSFEAELLDFETSNNTADLEAKFDGVADLECNRVSGAGKAAARLESEEEAEENSFLEGYAACHRAHVALSKLRKGALKGDSPVVDFLFDPAHPRNFFAMGQRIGGMSTGHEKKQASMAVQQRDVVVERRVPAPAPALTTEKPRPELMRSVPPHRPTFASELRGPQAKHNGLYVLANGHGSGLSISPSATVSKLEESGVNGVGGGSRPIIEAPAEERGNLIDLY